MIELPVHQMLAVLANIEAFRREYEQFPRHADSGFYLDNNWFGPVDAEVAYGMVRWMQPGYIVEVGSGMSTHVLAQAAALNETSWSIVAIDPEPRVPLPDAVRQLPSKVENVSPQTFDMLGPGDILFIDSSHVFSPGGDVDYLYNQILPAVEAGVIVHVHDIFIPYEYPSWWEHRGYDEQSWLTKMMESGGWDILWAGHYLHRTMPDALSAVFPSYRSSVDYPGSFWMVKR